jgi:hypothetical protein
MSHRLRWMVLIGACALAGCGGGGGGTSASVSSASSSSSSSSGSSSGSGSSSSSSSGAAVSNVVAITVDSGPAAANGGTFNIPYASVTVCEPGTTTCATIDHVLVDTGSAGLRIMASVLTGAGLSLTKLRDPANASRSIAECLPFADGYSWGPVAKADVSIAGESASDLSVHIINDNGSYAATVPNSCISMGGTTSLNSVSAFSANGVLGVGVLDQDCGTACRDCASFSMGCSTPHSDFYYSCTTGTDCAFTPVAMADQVRNPVALFAADNNGVVVVLPQLPTAGQLTASGSLIFGIGTQTNNGLGSATVLTTSNGGDIVTVFDSQTLGRSFIDSGSNGYFFPDASHPIPVCANSPGNPFASDFYCPTSTLMETASNQGQNGATTQVNFTITNLSNSNHSFYANATIGGPANASNPQVGTMYFDWGLPFFYGKRVFTAIEGKIAGSDVGPYYAY